MIEYIYDDLVQYLLQCLCLMLKFGLMQNVIFWKIFVEGVKLEVGYDDQYQNFIELVLLNGEQYMICIVVEGEVEMIDKVGVFGFYMVFVLFWFYCCDMLLIKFGKFICELVKLFDVVEDLLKLYQLMSCIKVCIVYIFGMIDVVMIVEQVMDLKIGVCQDYIYVFIVVVCQMGFFVCYVLGYLYMFGNLVQIVSYVWVEVYVDGFGWVGFDVVNDICFNEDYVCVVCGFDYKDVCLIFGMIYGVLLEMMKVVVMVEVLSQL